MHHKHHYNTDSSPSYSSVRTSHTLPRMHPSADDNVDGNENEKQTQFREWFVSPLKPKLARVPKACMTYEPRPTLLLVNSSASLVSFSDLCLRRLIYDTSSAQRNMYLTGFTLFLSIILTRTFYILLDLVHVQGEYAELKKAVSSVCLS